MSARIKTAIFVALGCGLATYAIISSIAVCNGTPPIQGDDGALILGWLKVNIVQVRWVLPMQGELWIFSILTSDLFKPLLPVCLTDQATVLPIVGSLFSGLGGAFVLWRFRSLAVVAVLVMPLWFRFIHGFLEVYPSISWGWMAVLAWFSEQPIRERAAISIGIICALLVAAHAEFIPIVALILVVRRSWSAIGWAAVWFVVVITCLCGTFPNYFSHLSESTVWDLAVRTPFRGFPHEEHGLSGWPFWQPSYAFSIEHIREIGGAWLYEAGWWALPLAIGGLFCLARSRIDDRWAMRVAILGWCLFFSLMGFAKRPVWEGPDIWWQSQIAWTFLSVDAMTAYWKSRKKPEEGICPRVGSPA